MSLKYPISFDSALLEEIAVRFDLREPNKRALEAVVKALAAASTLTDTEPTNAPPEFVADLATGVGKTFLMAALVDYLAGQGVRNVLVVTPGDTIQRKTVANFDEASTKHVPGSEHVPFVVTPENWQRAAAGRKLEDPEVLKVYVFNVQMMLGGEADPTVNLSGKEGASARRTRMHRDDENIGGTLYGKLHALEDLFIIADEHHVYRSAARKFAAAVRDLEPAALIGLTATPDPADQGRVVFQYSLGHAIADGFVKVPVIAYRKDGMNDDRTQLRDACLLLTHKADAYNQYRSEAPGAPAVNPILFVVCTDIEHAERTASILATDAYIGDSDAILLIHSQSDDEALQLLSDVERPDSPIRAIVSVNKLREGWDVRNIAVIVALRKMAEQSLTEQILGRGLRLPFGKRTGYPAVDQVDLVAHDSYKRLLAQKDALRQRMISGSSRTKVDPNGAAEVVPVTPEQEDNALAEAAAQGERGFSLLPSGLEALFEGIAEEDAREGATPEETAVLLLGEAEAIARIPQPSYEPRTPGAPIILFPRRLRETVRSTFSLGTVPSSAAQTAGQNLAADVAIPLFRQALTATRTGADVAIRVEDQKADLASQALKPLDTIRIELVREILSLPEVPRDRASHNAAERLVGAFLKGAGADGPASMAAGWGGQRTARAVDSLRTVIKAAINNRPIEVRYRIEQVEIPAERILVQPDAVDGTNDGFKKGLQYRGWKRSMEPVASFDAKTTEWELAKLFDAQDDIAWWLRTYVPGEVYIPTAAGRYYPDFVLLDSDGVQWIVEGKADSDAGRDDVQAKRQEAEDWARAVSDEGDHGQWRYLFATESHIKNSAGSWKELLAWANPD